MINAEPVLADGTLPDPFAFPPLQPSASLNPIRTWEAMYREVQITGVEFDAFWYECVSEGVVCFFSWTGGPRATVLVVLGDDRILHLECRGEGDYCLSAEAAAPIALELWRVLEGTSPSGRVH